MLNDEEAEIDIRQIAGLTLKAIMERSFVNISDDSLDYFKTNILKCYDHKNYFIRKTISNLINTFVRHAGTDKWPELLEFLYDSLNSDISVEMSLETINIIVEDSSSYLEENHIEVVYIKNSFFAIYLQS